MNKRNAVNELGFLRLDGRKKAPLFSQIYDSIRTAILEGRLRPNCRIPSSRDLVEQLGVSRTTVVTAIDLLIAEGYLQTIVGSGTFVSSEVPDDRPPVQARPTEPASILPNLIRKADAYLSQYGRKLHEINFVHHHMGTPRPFCPGEPALDEFPTEVWSKIVRRVWKTISSLDLSYGEPAGFLPLRKSIAEYLRVHRGARCETQQVMMVSGTQQAIDIVAKVSIDVGDRILFDNPGYLSASETFVKYGAHAVPVEIDEKGAKIEEAIEKYPNARLAYVTPSHQYPLGLTMPIDRRLALIKWAGGTGGLILEDDYDSEYRYCQKPIPCMQGLDPYASTIYVGSFSKVLFPALGLGYVIVPPSMAEVFENALRLTSRPGSHRMR